MIHFDLLADIALTRINNPTAKVILLAIARYANGYGECFPSRETISHDSCVPIRSVVRAIQWLEDEGYIRIVRRSGTSNFYVITSMEDDMTDETRANLAHEEDSNITKLDFSKKNIAKSNTTSRANLAHPLDTPFFLAFWQAYPRRIGKGDARAAFTKAATRNDPNLIVQAALAYAKHVAEAGTEQKFIPHASTWLNGERWEDDLEAEKVERKSKTGWGNVFDEL
jgi:DNA-binding transcriptional regulator YhcF (GntR family)